MTVFGRPVSALELGGWAVGLVGLFNLAGSLIWAGSAAGTPKKICWRCSMHCERWHS